MPGKTDPLFVYGTLLDDELRTAVIGRHRPLMMAIGHDARSQTVASTKLPALVKAAGIQASGALVWGLSDTEWKRVAQYEGDDYVLGEIEVSPTDGGPEITGYAFFARKGVGLLSASWEASSWPPQARDALLREIQEQFSN